MVLSRALALKPFVGNPAIRQFATTSLRRGGPDPHFGRPTSVIPLGDGKFRIAVVLSLFVFSGSAVPAFGIWYWTIK